MAYIIVSKSNIDNSLDAFGAKNGEAYADKKEAQKAFRKYKQQYISRTFELLEVRLEALY